LRLTASRSNQLSYGSICNSFDNVLSYCGTASYDLQHTLIAA
jgi:hypothetical protein